MVQLINPHNRGLKRCDTIDVSTININDIVELFHSYKDRQGEKTASVNKYLVVNKIMIKDRGIFFDLLDLSEELEKPVTIKGVNLRFYPIRKYFDANK